MEPRGLVGQGCRALDPETAVRIRPGLLKKLVIVSSKDKAGTNIKEALVRKFDFEETSERFDSYPIFKRGNYEILTSSKDIIFSDHINKEADLYVFASRHSSVEGIPCLTVHATGNFSASNEYGGRGKELSLTNSYYLKRALQLLRKFAEELGVSYKISQEVTHHGPTSYKVPSFFIEIGSSEEEWTNPTAAEVIAKTIMNLDTESFSNFISAIGFGGPHYAPKFTKLSLETNYAIGHICSKYAVDDLDRSTFRQMLEKTIPKPEVALIDWKGLRKDSREKVIKLLSEVGLKYERV